MAEWTLPGGFWPYDGRRPDEDGPTSLAYGDVLRWMMWKQVTLDIVPQRPLVVHCEHSPGIDHRSGATAVRTDVVWLFDGGVRDHAVLEERRFFLNKRTVTEWMWAQPSVSTIAVNRLSTADWCRVDHALRHPGSLSLLETPAVRRHEPPGEEQDWPCGVLTARDLPPTTSPAPGARSANGPAPRTHSNAPRGAPSTPLPPRDPKEVGRS